MEGTALTDEKKEFFFLEVLRFIACIGVFGGHFFGIAVKSDYGIQLCDFIRTTWLNKTILVYFISGDISVLFFFALGGFLLSYNTFRYEKKMTWKKVLNKELYLIIPSLSIIIIGAVIYMIKSFVFRSEGFLWIEILNDFRKILIGGLDDDIYPYYSYQLWYNNNAIWCLLTVSVTLLYVRENKLLRYILYVLLGFIFWRYSLRMDIFLMGTVAGEVVAQIVKKENNHILSLSWLFTVLGILPLVCVPLVYHEGFQKTVNIWGGGFLFVVSVSFIVLAYEYRGMFKIRGADKNNTILASVIRNSYSVYLVHVLVIASSPFVYGEIIKHTKGGIGLVFLLCILYFIFTIFIAELFRRIVLNPIRHIIC